MRSLLETGDQPIGALPMRRRTSRVLAAFLAFSIAVHAGVLALSPPLTHDVESPGTKALEVVILQPEPLPIASAARVPRVLPSNRTARAPVKALPDSQAAPRPSVLATAQPSAREDAFADAPPRRPQTAPAVLDPMPQAGGSERALLPSVSAAYLSNPAPSYPLTSRRAGEQGTVTLRVLVARDGLPMRVDVEKSSGSRHLDGAALEAVRGWRFVPARRGTEPLDSWLLVPVVFRLEGPS